MREHGNIGIQYTRNRFRIRSKLTKSALLIIWLSANCVETTGKTDKILCVFSLRVK